MFVAKLDQLVFDREHQKIVVVNVDEPKESTEAAAAAPPHPPALARIRPPSIDKIKSLSCSNLIDKMQPK